MLRPTTRRQSDSARTYLDFAALSPALDAAAHLTADTLGFPIALINIIDNDSQYTIAQHGYPASAGAVVPRSETVCVRTVDTGLIVAIDDAHTPGRLGPIGTDDSSVREIMLAAGVAAYAGIPLIGREGLIIGTLCVFDTTPRHITDTHKHLLTLSARVVQEHLDAQRDRIHPPVHPADAAELAAAITAGEITPWYQPIIDLDSGRLVAVEALARWNHPTRGLLTPAVFLDAANSSELIIDLDLTVLTRSLFDLRTWLKDEAFRLHVNLSGSHFAHPDCVRRIVSTVREAGSNPDSVVLEITESAAFVVSPATTHIVAELRRAGFGVVLDDIGVGWDGVERLLTLPLSGLKVDKVVTDRLGSRTGDAIMRALHSLAAELDLVLTVEGIETAEQAHAVAALGSVQGQGYWWGQPSPPSSIAGLVGLDLPPTDGRFHAVTVLPIDDIETPPQRGRVASGRADGLTGDVSDSKPVAGCAGRNS